ncbi:MAG: DNA methyltransferase [Candidatus Binataceae bacterium]
MLRPTSTELTAFRSLAAVAGLAHGILSEDNKLRREDRAAHDWYRFVLSFPPHLVRTYVKRFQAHAGNRILDPFCGTGTTLVESKKLGLASVGLERNPMACFASRIKASWNIDPDGLMAHAHEVALLALRRLQSERIEDEPALPLFAAKVRSTPPILRDLPDETRKLLLGHSISPLPLHKALVLLDALEEKRDERFDGHERLAFAKAMVFNASNLQFGPEVGVGLPKPDAAVVRPWLKAVEMMASDIRELSDRSDAPSLTYQGDARRVSEILEPLSVDVVITSPPYPNEKDYTRTTRLESVLLGFVRDKQGLRSLKQDLVRSNTRSVYKDDTDDRLIAENEEIEGIAQAIENRRIALRKTSGFERQYARVTKLYFGGMARHFADLRSVLRPGAQLAYVVGDQASYLRVMIRTGKLLADIATSLGYEVTGIDLFRTRLATATKATLREEVVILRWPGNARSTSNVPGLSSAGGN